MTNDPTNTTKTLVHRQQEYHRASRAEVVALVPASAHHILDVGCGDGIVGAQLRSQNAARYLVGIEADPAAALRARSCIDKVYQGKVEEVCLVEATGTFDCLIYGDILEHLEDPVRILRDHYALLANKGCAIVSVPNVQFYYVILSLLRGRWSYTDRGIFDRSHLRFFTLYEIRKVLENVGYHITAIKRMYRLFERPVRQNRFAKSIAWLPMLQPFLTYQYVLLAHKQERHESAG